MRLLAYLSLGLLGCLLVGPFIGDVHAVPTCPTPDWHYYGDHCYRFYPGEMSWSDAEEQCRRQRGHLASFHSQEEQNDIAYYVSSASEDVWIGLHAIEQPSGSYEWQWSDFTSVDYTAWGRTPPPPATPGKCVALDKATSFRSWKVNDCSDETSYLCKVDAV